MNKKKAKFGGDPFDVSKEEPEKDLLMCGACNEGMHEECLGYALAGRDVNCSCEPCAMD